MNSDRFYDGDLVSGRLHGVDDGRRDDALALCVDRADSDEYTVGRWKILKNSKIFQIYEISIP